MEHLFFKFFVAMFAIMNPFRALPVFLLLTKGRLEKYRFKIASIASLFVLILLCSIVIIGPEFLAALGVNIQSFEVAGGIIIFLLALSMLQAKENTMHNTTEEESKEHEEKTNPAIVPLAIPFLAGPGAISTVIVHSNKIPHDLENYAAIYTAIFSDAFLIWVVLCFATPLARLLGQTGINIMTRIMAIILASIGVEMIMNGIKTAFQIA